MTYRPEMPMKVVPKTPVPDDKVTDIPMVKYRFIVKFEESEGNNSTMTIYSGEDCAIDGEFLAFENCYAKSSDSWRIMLNPRSIHILIRRIIVLETLPLSEKDVRTIAWAHE